jgi:PilZ domain
MAKESNDRAGVPAAGTPATLLSLETDAHYTATVASWVGTDAGLVVSARLTVTSEDAEALAGHRVLVSVRERPSGFTVFSGLARPDQDGTLDISGIATMVREHRRRDLRGPAVGHVRVSTDGRAVPGLQAVDLSRSGVRVSLATASDLGLGDHVLVEVDLGYGAPFIAAGEVTRVDGMAGHAVVRFDDLSAEDGTLIDRFVLLQLPREMAPAN